MRVVDPRRDPLPPVPFGLELYKGKKSYKLPRHFVDFFLEHPVARALSRWAEDIFIPDESVVQSLARVSRTVASSPGNWTVEMEGEVEDPDHLQVWQADGGECRGVWRNSVCVFSLEDLSQLLHSGKHICNKFSTEKDPWVVDCLAELVHTNQIPAS